MSFNIGTPGFRIGPRGALDNFGSAAGEQGVIFNPHVVRRLLAYLRPYWKKMTALCLHAGDDRPDLLIPLYISIALIGIS
jgi:hypothetical protein